MDKFKELVKSNRSCRRFDNAFALDTQTLTDLVELARYTASGANNQPLKYIISSSREQNDKIFSCLTWAAYLKEWKGPEPAEQPTGYIVILGDTTISNNFWCDHGIAAQTILLGARERGLAGCMLGAIRREELQTALAIPARYRILLVIALGAPGETVVVDPMGADGDVRYWRDAASVHHVPNRALS
ncbi:MAG TPA: nitroreductase, partial [Desulfobacter sp.]|nr:nitroreductase [Desulfobacter sp.]